MLRVIVFLLLFSPQVFSQTIEKYLSFAIDNKEVLWVQVYHEDSPAKDISQKVFTHLKNKVWVEELAFDGDDLIGEIVSYRADYKRYGGKFTNTSQVVRTGKWSGHFRISF